MNNIYDNEELQRHFPPNGNPQGKPKTEAQKKSK